MNEPATMNEDDRHGLRPSGLGSPPPLPGWLEAMLPFRRYTVEVEGLQLHVMESGPSDGRPVLCLHGNPTWGFLYRKVAAALTQRPSDQRLRLVMPDLVGLGFSSKPRDPQLHTLENHARWIGALLDRLGLERLIFVGQDWGGPIGLRALADRQGVIGGMVLLNTVISPPRRGFRPTPFHRFSRMPIISDLVFRGLGFPQVWLGLAQGGPDRWFSIRGDEARAYRYPLRNLRENGAPLWLARMVPDSHDHPSIPDLARCHDLVRGFDGPAEIVWGDRDPVLGRVRGWVQKQLPHARVTRTDAGHFLQEQLPDQIAVAITRVADALG